MELNTFFTNGIYDIDGGDTQAMYIRIISDDLLKYITDVYRQQGTAHTHNKPYIT